MLLWTTELIAWNSSLSWIFLLWTTELIAWNIQCASCDQSENGCFHVASMCANWMTVWKLNAALHKALAFFYVASSNMASSSEAPDYDPKTDPARKAKSNDPGWKYAYWQDPARRDWVTCILCGNEAWGGIKRFKQHLVGGYEDIVLCPKVTTEIRKEMEAYLEKKRRRPLFLDGIEEEDGEDEVVAVAAADVQALMNHAKDRIKLSFNISTK